jgi:hypothetical protein
MRAFWAEIFLVFAVLTTSAQQTEAVNKTVVLHRGETVTVHSGDAVTVLNAVPESGTVLVVGRHDAIKVRTSAKRTVFQFLPRPFVYTGAGLMGGGYAPLAAEFGAGLRIDSQRFLVNAEGSYDNGHKTKDNDQPNPKGRDRGLVGQAYYRLSSGWFFGAGARWSQLSTTNYTKSGSRPTFGGGWDSYRCAERDCPSDFSTRLGVDYVLKGNDHINGSQGPLITFYMPSPSSKGHFFFRQTLGIYSFHDTVTDPTNALLTRKQMGNRHVNGFGELTMMFRF